MGEGARLRARQLLCRDGNNARVVITHLKKQPFPSFCRQLAKSLGQAGEIEPETEGILTEYGVDFSDFSPEALECLPQSLPWSISPRELAKRRDLR